MTDPERIATRSTGLAAQLLRAGRAEWPSHANLEKTLVVLGVSGAVLTAAQAAGAQLSSAASAPAGAVGGGGAGALASGAASGTTAKIASTALLAKWIGIGLVGGIGVAAVTLRPSTLRGPSTATSSPSVRPSLKAAASTVQSARSARSVDPPEQTQPIAPSMPRPTPVAPHPDRSGEPQLGHAPERETLLAAEVAFVDRARTALSAGQSQRSFALLQDYEQSFPERRLLPEVLFLRLESCERSGSHAEARAVAQRLVTAFPHSPHASRARSLLASP